jgi:hypothetical protein
MPQQVKFEFRQIQSATKDDYGVKDITPKTDNLPFSLVEVVHNAVSRGRGVIIMQAGLFNHRPWSFVLTFATVLPADSGRIVSFELGRRTFDGSLNWRIDTLKWEQPL